jgi:hypothetical protein
LLERIAARVTARFDCTACGNCCRRTRLEIGDSEIDAIARFLRMPPGEVRRRYTEPNPGGPGRLASQPAGECVLLDGNLCLFYEVRPRACRDFPYLTTTATAPGHRMPSIFARASYCPIVFNTLELLKAALGFHPEPRLPPGSRVL